MRRSLEAIVLLAAASALAMFLPCAAMAQETVTIGFSGPLTGPQAAAGQDNQAGANMAIDELNQKKPIIGGKPVIFSLMAEDDQANPKIGIAVAKKLIAARVKAVIGPYNSDIAIETMRMLNDANIVMATVGSHPRVTQQGFRYVFRLSPNDNQLGGEMAIYAAKHLNLKSVLIIEDGTVYGKASPMPSSPPPGVIGSISRAENPAASRRSSALS